MPAPARCPADFRYAGTQNNYSLADFVRARLGPRRPGAGRSPPRARRAPRCSRRAARMIAAGLADAAVVGGVDSLCLTTLYGFNALELLSTERCRPFDAARNGISIGEGAGFALLERDADAPLVLAGWGESGDAHHMSTPHPEGLGAKLAMSRALASRAARRRRRSTTSTCTAPRRAPTTSPKARPSPRCSARDVPCSATKGATGHLLGAAGITEAIVALLRARARRPARHGQHHAPSIRRPAAACCSTRERSRCALRAEQLVRLRRQQLRAGLREPRVIAACLDGIGVLGPGLAGLAGGARGARGRRALRGRRHAAAGHRPAAAGRAPPLRRRGAARHRRRRRGARRRARRTRPTWRACSPRRRATATWSTRSANRWPRRERDVSPTRFHNSVHNAPAGYWSIATGARGPSTSLCAHESSFAAGLLEAAIQAHAEATRVLLIAYDLPHPFPLSAVAPVSAPFGVALLLAPARLGRLDRAPRARRRARRPPTRRWRTPNSTRCARATARRAPCRCSPPSRGGGRARIAVAYLDRTLAVEIVR